MDAAERETFYDAEIAPALLELARRCEGVGISLVAEAEWTPGETGTTITVHTDAGIGLRMVAWAARAKGNADVLIRTMIAHGEKHGHNSVYLHMLERS
jgi:GNAT superfamily N-acetyltransferase